MTLQELKTKANAKLADFWTALQTKQTSYYLKHNKFFQLIVTDNVVDGVDTVWEIRKPNDEKHAVDVDFTFNSPVPFAISVDEWVGSNEGYSVTATVELPNGDRYSRTRTAVPIIQEATYDNTDIDNPVELTPKAVTGYTEEDTNWNKITPDSLLDLNPEEDGGTATSTPPII